MDDSKLTRRDWFAGMAMQGMLASQDERHDGKGTGIVYIKDQLMLEEFARDAYLIADAMEEVR